MELSRSDLAQDLAALHRRIATGPGVTSPAERQAAIAGERVPGELGEYLGLVRYAPIEVTDEQVAALRAGGTSDDALFELTVATALGAAEERLQAGLAALAEAQAAG